MERALRLGIVGMGGQGSRYTRFAEANPHVRVQVVAFMEAVPAVRTRKMADHGLPGYATVEEMLDTTELDAVLVATPDFAHREPVLAAVERGKHLLIEKPFATTLDDALVMYAAIKRAGVKAQICFQNRFHPAFTLARRAVDGGDIGDVLFINARQNCGGVAEWVAAGQRWYNQTDVAWSQLSHLIDVATWITGTRGQRIYATRVRKHLVSQGITTDDVIHASVLHDDGTDAIYEGAWCMPDQYPIGMDFRVDVVGTRGAVQANTSDQGIAITRPTGYRLGALNEVSLLGDRRGAHLDMLAAFARAVLDDTEPMIPVEDGLESTRILVAIHQSIETGQAVEMASLAPAGAPAS